MLGAGSTGWASLGRHPRDLPRQRGGAAAGLQWPCQAGLCCPAHPAGPASSAAGPLPPATPMGLRTTAVVGPESWSSQVPSGPPPVERIGANGAKRQPAPGHAAPPRSRQIPTCSEQVGELSIPEPVLSVQASRPSLAGEFVLHLLVKQHDSPKQRGRPSLWSPQTRSTSHSWLPNPGERSPRSGLGAQPETNAVQQPHTTPQTLTQEPSPATSPSASSTQATASQP